MYALADLKAGIQFGALVAESFQGCVDLVNLDRPAKRAGRTALELNAREGVLLSSGS